MMKNLDNGECDIFPMCRKAMDGLGNDVIQSCDGCKHWHKRKKDPTKACCTCKFCDNNGGEYLCGLVWFKYGVEARISNPFDYYCKEYKDKTPYQL